MEDEGEKEEKEQKQGKKNAFLLCCHLHGMTQKKWWGTSSSPQNKGPGTSGATDRCVLHFSTQQTKGRKKASFTKDVHFSEAVKIIIFIDIP